MARDLCAARKKPFIKLLLLVRVSTWTVLCLDIQGGLILPLRADDKRLQNTLKRLGVNNIPGIEEVGQSTFVSFILTKVLGYGRLHRSLHSCQVNLFRDNGTVVHFKNPKV